MNPETKYITRTLKIAVLPKGQPIFSEQATTIEIDDISGGEFLLITQQSTHVDSKEQQIQIDQAEWEPIRNGIEMMLKEIKEHSQK